MTRYKEEAGLICTQCTHHLGANFEYGPCPECGVPLDAAIVRNDWAWLYERKLGVPGRLREHFSRRILTCLDVQHALGMVCSFISMLAFIGAAGVLIEWGETQTLSALVAPFVMFMIFGSLAIGIGALAILESKRLGRRFCEEHWRRCWRCVRPVEGGPRGVCAHCREPWEYEMLKYAWRTRFKDLTENEKPKA
ncbi:MAG: hypothetical protein AAGI30_03255 [Planctomycetota bacterium]